MAGEQGWTKEEALESLVRKAGYKVGERRGRGGVGGEEEGRRRGGEGKGEVLTCIIGFPHTIVDRSDQVDALPVQQAHPHLPGVHRPLF